MSLDEAALKVWQTRRPPLTMLVAAKASELLGAELPSEIQGPFLSLSRALERWWPSREPNPMVIYENEFSACLAVYEDNRKANKLLAGARLQMAAVQKAHRRCFPDEGFYQLAEGDLQQLLRDAAKVGRLPVTQLEARLKHLLDHIAEPWPELIARASRMRWARGAAWGKLGKRLRQLASLADLGASVCWTGAAGRHTLHLELDGIKRIATLTTDEASALRTVIPALPEPG